MQPSHTTSRLPTNEPASRLNWMVYFDLDIFGYLHCPLVSKLYCNQRQTHIHQLRSISNIGTLFGVQTKNAGTTKQTMLTVGSRMTVIRVVVVVTGVDCELLLQTSFAWYRAVRCLNGMDCKYDE